MTMPCAKIVEGVRYHLDCLLPVGHDGPCHAHLFENGVCVCGEPADDSSAETGVGRMRTVVSRDEMERWFNTGVEQGATHMLVICDSFDYEDYPAYVMPDEDPQKRKNKLCTSDNMQKLMECYDLSADRDEQLKTRSNYNPVRP